MRRDSTTFTESQPEPPRTGIAAARAPRGTLLATTTRVLAAMAVGALLLALVYQLPVTHTVDVGGYDAAYVQGFFDPERASPASARPELDGADGSARWTGATSHLIFPQAGMPARLTLRLRGWRASGEPPRFSVLLNGSRPLGEFQSTLDWQEYDLSIDGGLLKPNDVVIEIRSDTARLAGDDPRDVGVLVDRATLRVGPAPIVPYPPQLAYGALAAGLLYVLISSPTSRLGQGGEETRRPGDKETSRATHFLPFPPFPLLLWLAGVVLLAVAFLALYRAQPFYPYPLRRLLPVVDGVLLALLVLRRGPALARRVPALLDALALGGIAAWLAAILLAAQSHVTLALPGVEKDFRVFALRSAHLAGQFPAGTTAPDLDGVLRADGFYNLGYPLLLWLARPLFGDNPFLAARLVAALSGALLICAGWWLARRLLGRGPALLAVLMLGLSPLVAEYALYLGTDMPFAALCALALALIVEAAGGRRQEAGAQEPRTKDQGPTSSGWRVVNGNIWLVAAAGVVAGMAFLVRHPGLLLLTFGWLVLLRNHQGPKAPSISKDETSPDAEKISFGLWRLGALAATSKLGQSDETRNLKLVVFTLAFVLAILPQIAVNVRDTGQPLYSQQAKNVWQAVFGAGDWGRWGETANDISIGSVIAQDPARFAANWWNNLRGFFGTGGEDTREFGQAVQLRLLAFPANWLAVAGLLGWLAAAVRSMTRGSREIRGQGNGETETQGDGERQRQHFSTAPLLRFSASWLLIWIALYVVFVSVGLAPQGRFFLPLAPVYALAAAWLIARLDRSDPWRSGLMLPAGLLLLLVLWGGFRTGADYALRARPADEPAIARAEGRAELPGQPADEVGIIRLAQATLKPGERLIVRADPSVPIGKYSAIAHLAVVAQDDTPAALRASGAQYLIWSSALGPAPQVGAAVGAAGSYTLYRIEP